MQISLSWGIQQVFWRVWAKRTPNTRNSQEMQIGLMKILFFLTVKIFQYHKVLYLKDRI